jgi:hypothetical protein
MFALLLGGRYFAADERPGLEDALESKCRLVVELFRRLSCIRFSNSPVRLFWLAHFDLILLPSSLTKDGKSRELLQPSLR